MYFTCNLCGKELRKEIKDGKITCETCDCLKLKEEIKSGTMWLGKKEDVTKDVINAMFDLLDQHGSIYFKGKDDVYREMSLKEIKNENLPEDIII